MTVCVKWLFNKKIAFVFLKKSGISRLRYTKCPVKIPILAIKDTQTKHMFWSHVKTNVLLMRFYQHVSTVYKT